MQAVSRLTLLAAASLASLAFLPALAMADVFKCTTADGKTSYSAAPCTAADAKEVVVPIVAAPAGKPAQGKDWAAENAAVNARTRAAEEAAAARNAQKASAPAKSAQEIAAECESNRGAHCGQDTVPTPEEAAALQRAAAGRRENEREAAAAEKVKAEAKAKADAAAAAAAKPPPVVPTPGKPGKS